MPEKKVELQVIRPESKDENTGTIDTSYGPVRYTTHGDLTKPAFVTYHDIGLNHENCFSQFFNLMYNSGEDIFDQFCIVHIDAPGHDYDASEVDASVAHFEMDELAEHVEKIVDLLNLKAIIGVGSGAGAYVLLLHTLKYPSKTRGLILQGVSGRKCGWIEWSTKWINMANDSWWRQWFLKRWFGQTTLKVNDDLKEMYWRELDRINGKNLFKYVQGFQRRTDILEQLKKISCPVLLFVGDLTFLEAEAIEVLGALQPGKGEMIRVLDTGCLVTVERPQKIIVPTKLMLQGMGYF